MAEAERTRLREREAPSLNAYELGMAKDKAWAERQQTGRIVVRRADTPQELMRQGYPRYYLVSSAAAARLSESHQCRAARF